ncbi:hypothetical protein A2U01_0110641 [Trifolium medium]|uniref:Uncharacterized protein n=1 Tax=Trifolium medium TaxID=97028 RepID=A0A392VPD3_9FABA|nr:hypothetical protein [Trifolium medium]
MRAAQGYWRVAPFSEQAAGVYSGIGAPRRGTGVLRRADIKQQMSFRAGVRRAD